MATENIDVRIRERGAAATSRKIKKIGTDSRTASGGVRLLIGALAGFSIAGFLRAGEAIEDTKIALEGLLGSTKAAEAAFKSIDTLATDVKQGINELSGAFLILESAGIGSVKNLELAADVGTVFKRSTEDVALALRSLETETLRNAFGFDQVSTAAGNFSASLGGIVVAQADTRAGFRQAILDFVEQSRFAGAASKANEAFGTGLSTIGNQVNKLSAALRSALGPGLAVVAGEIKDVTTGLLELIETSQGDVFGALLGQFATVVDAGADVAEILESIGVDTKLVANQFVLLQKAFAAFFASIGTGFQAIRTTALALIAALAELGNRLGFVSDEARDERIRQFNDATIDLAKSSADTADKLKDYGAQLIENAKSAFDLTEKTDEGSEALREYAEAARRARLGLRGLREEQEALTDSIAAGSAVIPTAPAGPAVAGGGRADADVFNPFGDPDLAFDETLRLLGAVAKSKEIDAAGEESGTAFGEAFGQTASTAIGSVLRSSLRGDAIEFGDILADFAAKALEESLSEVLENIFNQLANVKTGDGTTTGGGGGGFGQALGQLALVGAIVQQGLKKTSSSARTGLAKSAVTSVQETRGLIAGPSNIPIQQVGDSLREAFVPLLVVEEAELQRLTDILGVLRAQGPGTDATATLDEVLSAELGTSTSLP